MRKVLPIAIACYLINSAIASEEAPQAPAEAAPPQQVETILDLSYKNLPNLLEYIPRFTDDLRVLDLSRNYQLRDIGPEVLSEHMPKNLISLSICAIMMTDAGMRKIAPHLPRTLVIFKMANNFVGDPGMVELAKHPLPPALEELDLSGNKIGRDGIDAIAPRFPPTLKLLDLGRNLFGSAGGKALSKHIPPNLISLDVRGNDMGATTVNELIMALPEGLTVIAIDKNHIDAMGVIILSLDGFEQFNIELTHAPFFYRGNNVFIRGPLEVDTPEIAIDNKPI